MGKRRIKGKGKQKKPLYRTLKNVIYRKKYLNPHPKEACIKHGGGKVTYPLKQPAKFLTTLRF